MDRHAEPSQVIANGLPALEVREARQKSLKLKMLRFFQWATRLSGCLVLAIRLSASLPNILIIQTDEHHFQTLGCYGGQIVQTPHIDRLASEGALCTSFYATTPVCSPSRAALLTGLYPQHNRVAQNNVPLPSGTSTLGSILQQRGYRTGYIGKWHLDGDGKPQWAPSRSFGFEDRRFMFNRGHWKKIVLNDGRSAVGALNRKGEPSYELDDADEKTFATDFLTDRALEFMGQKEDRPFFLMLSFPDPHGPNSVRKPYDTLFDDVTIPIPDTIRKPDSQIPAWAPSDAKITVATLRRLMPKYFGMVKCIDDNVGRILHLLEQTGALNQTLIVFTSDHGDLCGEHGRLNKGNPYEGSARIPFLMRYPSEIPFNTRIGIALSCVDFLPTLNGVLDLQISEVFNGRDASQWFRGNPPPSWNDITFLRSSRGGNWLCAVSDRYKLVVSSGERPWLMDLQADPTEALNHASDPQKAEVLQSMARALKAYAIEEKDPLLNAEGIGSSLMKLLSPPQ